MNDMTNIPESIAKQPIDPNADHTEICNIALELVRKVFKEIEQKELLKEGIDLKTVENNKL
jgi:hypothetical protein